MKVLFLEEQIQRYRPTFLRNFVKFELRRRHQPIFNPPSDNANDVELRTVTGDECPILREK